MNPRVHHKTATLLSQISSSDSVSHAYIISGSYNAFPSDAAQFFAQKLMNRPDPENSVDFRFVTSDKTISIELVRDLKTNVRYGPVNAPFLVTIVEPADRLTPEAANALLKLLEEPPSNVVFLLVTSYPELLLPTIHSRCQKIHCFAPTIASPTPANPSLAELISMPLRDRLELANEISADKEGAKAFFGDLIEELALKSTLTNAEKIVSKILIEKLNAFKYNVNLKLHLESIMIEIDLGIGVAN